MSRIPASMERSFRSRSPSVTVDADYAEDRKRGTTPSQRLLVAIMRRAIWDFVLYKDENPKAFKDEDDRKKCQERLEIAEDAAGWLFWDGEEETDGEGRYTFKFICEMLDLKPSDVRARALAMTLEDIQTLNNHIKED
jgi:hypothetical protein